MEMACWHEMPPLPGIQDVEKCFLVCLLALQTGQTHLAIETIDWSQVPAQKVFYSPSVVKDVALRTNPHCVGPARSIAASADRIRHLHTLPPVIWQPRNARQIHIYLLPLLCLPVLRLHFRRNQGVTSSLGYWHVDCCICGGLAGSSDLVAAPRLLFLLQVQHKRSAQRPTCKRLLQHGLALHYRSLCHVLPLQITPKVEQGGFADRLKLLESSLT
mmetsp:Transcript_99786/g.182980  ORF Transcript_99786/g.182980 Transcript_99786/m.182980 type:complete len:216 (-) Transcript_99786:1-648(-)